MRVNELALSQAVLPSLAKVGIHEVEQLAEHRTGELLRRPELSSGVELHELICELHRHGLTPFSRHGGHVQTDREREMFRLRAVEGLTLDEIGPKGSASQTSACASFCACTSVSMEYRPPRKRRSGHVKQRPSTFARTTPAVSARARGGEAPLPPGIDAGNSRQGARELPPPATARLRTVRRSHLPTTTS